MSNDEKSSLIFEDTREDLFLSKKMGGGGAGSAAVVLGLAAVRRCLAVDIPIREGRTDSLCRNWFAS